MSLRRLWLPAICTTVRVGPGAGMPNGSLTPWTMSTGTVTASSSSCLVAAGRPGGCRGNARHRTPTAPVSRRGPAGDAGARRPPAAHDRQPLERPAFQIRDDRVPGGVELVCRRRRAPAGDSVGLLDQRDAELLGLRHLAGRDQVARGHATAGAVAKHDRAGGAPDLGHVRPRRPVRCFDLNGAGSRRHRRPR